MDGTRDAEHVKRGKRIRGDGEDVNEHTDKAGESMPRPSPECQKST